MIGLFPINSTLPKASASTPSSGTFLVLDWYRIQGTTTAIKNAIRAILGIVENVVGVAPGVDLVTDLESLGNFAYYPYDLSALPGICSSVYLSLSILPVLSIRHRQ
jgi:hypothetical protein